MSVLEAICSTSRKDSELEGLNAGSRKPYIDESGAVHWPMVFVYPETMQNDIVEDAKDQDTLKVSHKRFHTSSIFKLCSPKRPVNTVKGERLYSIQAR